MLEVVTVALRCASRLLRFLLILGFGIIHERCPGAVDFMLTCPSNSQESEEFILRTGLVILCRNLRENSGYRLR